MSRATAPRIGLAGAVVAITGGARGIGRATAERFAREGATVCLGDLDGDAARATAAAIGPRAHAFPLDVASRASFAVFVGEIEATVGPIDVLVNNAGIMPAGGFLDEADTTTAAILDVNVQGPINGLREVLPPMIARGRGHVVNVASMLGKLELPGLATYTASKYAVVGLSAAVRAELDGTGVTLTTVLPAVVATELSSGIPIPFARLIRVEPEEIAAAIVASCARPRAEVAVPRWIGLYPVLRPFVPDRVEGLIRRLIGDDKALTAVDPAGRAGYAERVARQSAARAAGSVEPETGEAPERKAAKGRADAPAPTAPSAADDRAKGRAERAAPTTTADRA